MDETLTDILCHGDEAEGAFQGQIERTRWYSLALACRALRGSFYV